MKNIILMALLLFANNLHSEVFWGSYEGGVRDCYNELKTNTKPLIDQAVCYLNEQQIEKINNGAGISDLHLNSSQIDDVRTYCSQRGKLREELYKKNKLTN